MLTLPIKKKWFNMIKSGEKKEEYRNFNQYYHIRFKNLFGFTNKTAEIKFRNGYGKNSPTMTCRVGLRIGKGIPEWGAEPNKEYYVLEILEILEVQNEQ